MKQGFDKSIEINKTEFIRLVANEAGFTISDTRIIWNTMQKVIARIIVAEKTLNLTGFGKFYISVTPPGRAWDQINKQYYDREESKRVVFRLSSTIKNLWNNEFKNVMDDDDFEEVEDEDDLDLEDLDDEDGEDSYDGEGIS
jgi:nucleoid DNA-binding protein